MTENVKRVLIFVAGAGIGVLASWRFFKKKYERIANDKIASVTEHYRNKVTKAEEPTDISSSDNAQEEDDDAILERQMTEYKSLAARYASKVNGRTEEDCEETTVTEYTQVDGEFVPVKSYKEKGGDIVNRPYVIKPEEFGNGDYETVSLTYYSDGVLTDDFDNPIEDIDYYVGEESLDHFGEYEDDSVFVRNDNLETDFEILLVEESYYVNEEEDD